jgi:hypothetical protein
MLNRLLAFVLNFPSPAAGFFLLYQGDMYEKREIDTFFHLRLLPAVWLPGPLTGRMVTIQSCPGG